MIRNKMAPEDLAAVRREAKSRLDNNEKMENASVRSAIETERLLYELQVHQIELEMQNEELQRLQTELEAGLKRYTELYDFAPVGYFTLDSHGTIIEVNLTGALFLGKERGFLEGNLFGFYVTPADRFAFSAFLAKVFMSGNRETTELVLQIEKKKQLHVLIDAKITDDGRQCLAVLTDITDRKLADAALREAHDELDRRIIQRKSQLSKTNEQLSNEILEGRRSEDALEESEAEGHAIDNSNSGFSILIDYSGTILLANDVFAGSIDKSLDDLIGANIFEVLPDDAKKGLKKRVNEVIKSRLPIQYIDQRGDKWYDNTIFPTIGKDGSVPRLAIYIRDITEQKKAKDDLTTSQDQIRHLAAHLQVSKEEDRVFLSREIHDQIGPVLSSLKIDLYLLNRQFSGGSELFNNKIRAMSDLIDSTIGTVNQIVRDLRPPVLDHLGLRAAIEWYVNSFSERTGIDCELFLCEDDLNLGLDRSVTVFRILQESLNNVYRHSEASRVSIDVNYNDKSLTLTVSDNGIGISEFKINDPYAFGIIGIRERCHSLGGEATFSGKRGKGTTVTAKIPLQELKGRLL